MPTLGSSSTSYVAPNGVAHFVKSRHGPFFALMSIMTKLKGQDSPAYWDVFSECGHTKARVELMKTETASGWLSSFVHAAASLDSTHLTTTGAIAALAQSLAPKPSYLSHHAPEFHFQSSQPRFNTPPPFQHPTFIRTYYPPASTPLPLVRPHFRPPTAQQRYQYHVHAARAPGMGPQTGSDSQQQEREQEQIRIHARERLRLRGQGGGDPHDSIVLERLTALFRTRFGMTPGGA
jgi:hypothetical protein